MLVLSIDHRATDSATIAALGRRADRLRAALSAEPAVRGFVVLATCARVEAYLDAAGFHAAHRAFVQALAEASGADTAVATLTRSIRGPEGLEHLFRVASGLESAVVGEVQVGGQVRDALLAARAAGSTTRPLDLAFENAIRVSRTARAMLRGERSIVGAALDALGDRPMGIALVIGTGTFAQSCMAALRQRGAHTVWAHSPSGRTVTPEGVDHLIAARELVETLAVCDVVVAASGHGPAVVTEQIAVQAMAQRSTPLVLVDLAAAGDVAVELDDHPDVRVLRIDDVSQHGNGSIAATRAVQEEARALFPRIEGRELDDLIVALRDHVRRTMEAELGPATSPELAESIRRATQALLHEPTCRAREAAADGDLERYRTALETVFGIDSTRVSTATDSAA